MTYVANHVGSSLNISIKPAWITVTGIDNRPNRINREHIVNMVGTVDVQIWLAGGHILHTSERWDDLSVKLQ